MGHNKKSGASDGTCSEPGIIESKRNNGSKFTDPGIFWDNNELNAVNQAWLGVCEVFNKVFSEAFYRTYFAVLGAYRANDVVKALKQSLVSCKFFPKIAELVEFMEEDSNLMANRAWVSVEDAIKRIGIDGNVHFMDPKTKESVRLIGGWRYLCSAQESEWKWLKRDFVAIYTTMKHETNVMPLIQDKRKKVLLVAMDRSELVDNEVIRNVTKDRTSGLTNERRSKRDDSEVRSLGDTVAAITKEGFRS